jgi:hypothetical protein
VIDGTELRKPHPFGRRGSRVGSDSNVRIVDPLVANIRHLLLKLPHHPRHDTRVLRLVEDIEELKGVLLGVEELPLLFFTADLRAWEAEALVVPVFEGSVGGFKTGAFVSSLGRRPHTSRSVCIAYPSRRSAHRRCG